MPYSSSLDVRMTDTCLRDGSHPKRHQFTTDEVRRTRMWIQHDQRFHWEGEVRRRQQEELFTGGRPTWEMKAGRMSREGPSVSSQPASMVRTTFRLLMALEDLASRAKRCSEGESFHH